MICLGDVEIAQKRSFLPPIPNHLNISLLADWLERHQFLVPAWLRCIILSLGICEKFVKHNRISWYVGDVSVMCPNSYDQLVVVIWETKSCHNNFPVIAQCFALFHEELKHQEENP